MAKVNGFEFGSIVIDDKQYGYDVVILPRGSVKEREANKAMFGNHTIRRDEIEELAKTNPETVLVGTGTSEMAAVSEDAQAYAREAKISLVVLPSSEAVKKLNQLMDEGRPAAALIHITC